MAKNIIIGALNWGIGHATRMVPLIAYLQANGAQVTLASDGRAQEVLAQQFPALPMVTLPGYGVQYTDNKAAWWATMKQSGKINRAIQEEHVVLEDWLRHHTADLVVSDNRYGFWSSHVPSVFLTHQFHPAAPLLGRWAMKVWARRQYRSFSTVYIVDDPALDFAGTLSAPAWRVAKARPIGPLSAFTAHDTVIDHAGADQAFETVVLLSGPEPQRTILAESILAQLVDLPTASVVVVGGAPELVSREDRYIPYLSPDSLATLLRNAGQVIGRAGYSTLMDIAYLQKPALVIPTPGQPEQTYLARHWANRGWTLTTDQASFSLVEALSSLQDFKPSFSPDLSKCFTQFTGVLDEWLAD